MTARLGELEVERDPAELGFDAARLDRIDAYLQRYVDDGALPGWQFVLTRHGDVVHTATGGRRDRERDLPVEPDTLFRIYSMTKPVTSVAAMMLYELGAFQLSDPVSTFLPAFADVRVYAGGSDLRPSTVPATEPVRMIHLLTHTAGLTYGFFRQHPVDALYRAAILDGSGEASAADLGELCDRIAGIPLLFQPGSEWAYSMATDVLGRVVEVLSGQRLGEFFAQRIFSPLGMTDTGFGVRDDQLPRLARLYAQQPGGLSPADGVGASVDRPKLELGGGGLISSAHDYHRFTQMLLRGGELDGHRLLSPRTVRFMTRNHLPGNADLEQFGRPLYSEVPLRGAGFGLGFSVDLEPPATGRPGSAGTYAWGGAASTLFWVDPVEQLTAMFFTQVFTLRPLALRGALRQVVYQALVDDGHCRQSLGTSDSTRIAP
jgi:CubicO group peptidase (beta-lactamase class C family)